VSERPGASGRGSQGPGADAVGHYLAQLRGGRLLDVDEERRLGRTIRAGLVAAERLTAEPGPGPDERRRLRRQVQEGAEARDEFIVANLRLVVSVARRYGRGGALPLEDLIQEGNIGLLKAVERFDPEMGFKFSTYATWWIRQAVGRAIENSGRSIRIPSHAEARTRHVLTIRGWLEVKHSRRPTLDELAEACGLTAAEVAEALAHPTVVASLDAPVDGLGELELGDTVADEGPAHAQQVATQVALDQSTSRLLAVLDERERRIICLRHGLEDRRTRTCEEVGRTMQLSRERIRQIEAVAMSKLRHPSSDVGARDVLRES